MTGSLDDKTEEVTIEMFGRGVICRAKGTLSKGEGGKDILRAFGENYVALEGKPDHYVPLDTYKGEQP